MVSKTEATGRGRLSVTENVAGGWLIIFILILILALAKSEDNNPSL